MPSGPNLAQFALFPQDANKLAAEASAAQLKLDGPYHAFLVQGDDELGALANVHEQLFRAGVDVAGDDRLFTTHKTSIIQPLPVSYKDEIARVPGVTAVTHSSWFGGIYQNPGRNFQGVFQSPVEPEAYLAMYPEFQVPEDQRRAWIEDREGVLSA